MSKRKKTIAPTTAEQAACCEAATTLRTGQALSAKTRRHLLAARKKLHLSRYGSDNHTGLPAAAPNTSTACGHHF